MTVSYPIWEQPTSKPRAASQRIDAIGPPRHWVDGGYRFTAAVASCDVVLQALWPARTTTQ